MIVFNNYFKIVKKNSSTILMYTIIFIVFAVAMSLGGGNSNTDFISNKPKVLVINNDQNSVLTNTFVKYIENNTKVITMENVEYKIKDAMFFREIDYVLTIPQNFGNDFIKGLNTKIETKKVLDSYNSTYLEMIFNRFLNVAKTYIEVGMSEQEISNIIIDDLNVNTNVTLLEKKQSELSRVGNYYNFLNYTLLATLIFVVGLVINVFNSDKIKKRNIVSNTSYKQINKELFLGNIVLMISIWIIYVILSILLYKEVMISLNGILIIINSFIFSVMALSIGILIGNLVKNKEAQNGIVNVIALGSSFVCGAFVPQSMLSQSVLNVSKILPSYWFIKNNNDIATLSNATASNIKPIILNMLVIFAFTIVFVLINNIVTKFKLKNN